MDVKKIKLIIYLCLLSVIYLNAQISNVPDEKILDRNLSNTIIDINALAKKKISLKQGFKYTATQNRFKASLDPLNLEPDSYSTYKLGGSENGIVGSIDGAVDVSSQFGSLSYNIPIQIPAGTGGMQPSLAITYNSGAQDGLLGYGFELSGFSVINRNPEKGKSVSFNDKYFMLDGEPLIPLADQSTTGAREYRKKKDDFSKILALGSDETNPESFMVYTKSGLIYEYRSNNSKLTKSTVEKKSLFWFLFKVTDTKGNYYTISYEKDDENFEYWPVRIDYTGNDNAGLIPYSSVRFEYITESNPRFYYIADKRVQKSKRMTAINVYHGDMKTRSYLLDYHNKASYSASFLLKSVTEESADGVRKNPTKFEWNNLNYKHSRTDTTLSSSLVFATVGNFTHSGKTECLYMTLKTDDRYYIDGISEGIHKHVYVASYAGDLNGDGYDDLLIHKRILNDVNDEKDDKHYLLKYYNVTSDSGSLKFEFQYEYRIDPVGVFFPIKNIMVADLNGDGLADYIAHDDNEHYTISKSGEGVDEFKNKPKEIEVLDTDGDGSLEMICFHDTGYDIYRGYGGLSFHNITTYTHDVLSSNSSAKHFIGDFNGDGKSDIITRYRPNGENSNYICKISYSTGNGFVTQDLPLDEDHKGYLENTLSNKECRIFVGDINGDGMSDFYLAQKIDNSYVGAMLRSYLNVGDKFKSLIHAEAGSASAYSYIVGDFDGLGTASSILQVIPNSEVKLHRLRPYTSDKFNNLLDSIEDGLGNIIKVTYKRVNDIAVHTPGNTFEESLTARTAILSANMPIAVVNEISRSNGIGGYNSTKYNYSDLLLDRGNKILGFKQATVYDEASNTKQISNFIYNSEFDAKLLLNSSITKINDKKVNSTEYQYSLYNTTSGSDGHPYYIKTDKVIEQTFDYDKETNLSYTITTYEDDLTEMHGNCTKITTDRYITIGATNSEIVKTITENSYEDNEDKWFLGRLKSSSSVTVNEKVNKAGPVRGSEFEYDAESGLLTSEKFLPYNQELGYTKTYKHDVYGNIEESTTTPNDIRYAARTQKSVYDSKGRFLKETINEMGFKTQITMNEDLGVMLSSLDFNNIKTEYTYDSFGQPIMTKTPISRGQTVRRWSKDHEDAPDHAVYFVFSESSGITPQLKFYDSLGRLLREVNIGFNNKKIYTDVKYNNKGQVEYTSDPYFSGDQAFWSKNVYDEAGRIIRKTLESSSSKPSIYYSYSAFQVKEQDLNGKFTTKIMDRLGRLVKSIDNIGGTVVYEYDLDGNCVKVTGPRTVINTEFDLAGNRIKLIDPDLGTISYEYNAFGELVWQEDAQGEKTYSYDKLGRLIKSTAPDNILTYSYDSQYKGQLSSIDKNNFQVHESYSYDKYGRNIKTTQQVDNKSYVSETSYDEYGRVNLITYPSGFKVKNTYNNLGYLEKVINHTDNKSIWEAKIVNARGQLEQMALGNGLTTKRTYDEAGLLRSDITQGINSYFCSFHYSGNLLYRNDGLRGLREDFFYDNLNRLNRTRRSSRVKSDEYEELIAYDAAGNIISKTQTYYNDYMNSDIEYQKDFGTFEYYEGTNRLKSITGGDYTPPDWDEIKYTSFSKIYYVRQGSSSLNLTYGVDNQRIKSVTNHNGTSKTKYYLAGGIYEEEHNGNSIKQIHYIYANGESVAITEQTGANRSTLYLHKDHLGSALAYSDDAGKLAQELSYDAWGARRDPNTWNYYDKLSDAQARNDKGFTGHEHLDIFEMINMNGRMYDPMIGRFLTPDPFVQAPDNTQGLNRYIYCLNNPISFVDPSGYSWFSKNWKSLLSAAVGITVSALTGGAGGMILVGGLLGGMSSAITGAILNGANFDQAMESMVKGGLWGTVGAAASFGVGELNISSIWLKMGAHGTSQAAVEGLQGGNMFHGFIAAVAGVGSERLSSKMGIVGKVAISSVVGGTVSEIGGGKFANGAITAAYVTIFNQIQHQILGDKGLVEYVKKHFKKRIPEGTVLIFNFTNEANGEIEIQYNLSTPPKEIEILIPLQHWGTGGDPRLLYDCVDHELVHADDYASGRTYRYYKAFDGNVMTVMDIMEYKAYNKNFQYDIRRDKPLNSYDPIVNELKKKLPKGWEKIK